jgi:hypothetical protein
MLAQHGFVDQQDCDHLLAEARTRLGLDDHPAPDKPNGAGPRRAFDAKLDDEIPF